MSSMLGEQIPLLFWLWGSNSDIYVAGEHSNGQARMTRKPEVKNAIKIALKRPRIVSINGILRQHTKHLRLLCSEWRAAVAPSPEPPSAGEVFFKAANIVEAFPPSVFRQKCRWNLLLREKFWMQADHQHFFVIPLFENANASTVRQTLHAAPKKIMIEVFGRWRFKEKYLATRTDKAGS